EGSYSEVYPDCSEDEEGLLRLFKQFSFPGGIGSHCTPETPGSIHEGGELGYCLSHACGAAFDNPDLIVAAVVGDGESETGPLATSWHVNKFLNPVRDGAVLPILHLNGYKINNPTIWARVPHDEIEAFFRGTGWTPYFVEGSDPESMHQAMAATIDKCVDDIRAAQDQARASGTPSRPRWPMIVLRTPKGWTSPAEVGGHKLEGSWRAHQVPMADVKKDPARLRQLEDWMRGYKPAELFDERGRLRPELRAIAPTGTRRIGSNPHANGGHLKRALRMPDFRKYGVKVEKPGTTEAENCRPLGVFLRDVMKANMQNFRVFGPDENTSNKLNAIYEVSKKLWLEEYFPEDADGTEIAPDGRVIEMLSEHTLEGQGRVPEPAHHLDRLAAGPQRVHPPGPGVPRRGGQQERRGHPRLPAAGRQLPAVRRRPLPAQRRVHQRDRLGQAEPPAVPDRGRGDRPLHQGALDLGQGEHRPGHRAGGGDGLCGRHPDQGGAGRHRPPAPGVPGPEAAVRQRGEPVQAPARHRAPARALRQGLRQPVHGGQAGHLRVPRVPVADPPAGLPADEPPEPARAGLQGEGEHQHPAGVGHPEPDRPVHPGDGRDRPGAAAAGGRCPRQGEVPQPADRVRQLRLRARRRSARGRQLEV